MANLSQQELDRLAQAITEAEKTTSGEMRLIIVKNSTRASYLFPMLWLALSLLSLLVLWQERHAFWLHESPIVLHEPWWLVPALLGGSGALAYGLSQIPWLKRLFIPKAEMAAAVWTRAELEFYREGLNHTDGATGILLFLSLFEHQAVVLGDKAIAQKLKPETWNEVIGHIVRGAKTKQWVEHLEKAIQLCGQHLRQHFPPQVGDKNELPNHVIVKD
ncbi:MAG: hypothetical protein KF799_06325 [Bdellovibrionales bacterium]|nr:hypothetical protein [Bdellovibrionales bacterium]